MNFRFFIFVAVCLFFVIATVVKAQDSTKVAALEQRMAALEQELAKKDAPVITASANGFTIKSADGAYAMKFRGYFHTDSRVFFSDRAELGANTFVVRRVRPIIEGTLAKNFDYRIMLDFGQGSATLQDLHLDINFIPQFKIRFGKFKSPFALERLQSATALTFIERAFPTNLGPNRDVGVMLFGELFGGALEYFAGAFNGVLDGSSGDLDATDGKNVTGRVFSQPFAKSHFAALKGLGLGIAGDIGNQDGSATSTNFANYRTSGQAVFFRLKPAVAAVGAVDAGGQRSRLSPQGYYYSGPFGLMAEYTVSSRNLRRTVDTTSTSIVNRAWQVSASLVLTGEQTSFRGTLPKNPFDPAKGEWGAFELTVRAHSLIIDDDAFPMFADQDVSAKKALAWTVGINWYLNKHAKFALNFEQTSFDGGAITGDRPTEKILLSRFQMAY
jgi:phosphate-selective porin OprO/OprP